MFWIEVSAADVISGVEVTVESDDTVEIFVSTTNRNPTEESNMWQGRNRIVITANDPKFDPSALYYHVGVLGKNTAAPSFFSIQVLVQTPEGTEVTTLLYGHLQAEVYIC